MKPLHSRMRSRRYACFAVLLAAVTFAAVFCIAPAAADTHDESGSLSIYEYNVQNCTIMLIGPDITPDECVNAAHSVLANYSVNRTGYYKSVITPPKIEEDSRLVGFGYRICPEGQSMELTSLTSRDYPVNFAEVRASCGEWLASADLHVAEQLQCSVADVPACVIPRYDGTDYAYSKPADEPLDQFAALLWSFLDALFGTGTGETAA